MSAWQSYRLEDFIPFSAEVYWRLIERINEAFWPLHVLAVALGLATVSLALRGNKRIALALLAPAWLGSGIIFHLSYYAEINWAAPWFGWAFVAEAAMLLAASIFSKNDGREHGSPTTYWIGATISIAAVLGYPFIAAVLGADPAHAEVFGLHPDPTAIATLGVALLALRGATAWFALAIPLFWCSITTLTLVPLQAAWAWLPLVLAAATLVTLATARISAARRATDHPQR